MEKCLAKNLLIDYAILHTNSMPQINLDPKVLIAGAILVVVILLAIFSEFLLPLAIILVPIVAIFGYSQLKKNN